VSAPNPARPPSAWVLPLLLLILPFEPRRPTLRTLGLELTLTELAAAAAIVFILWSRREQVLALLRRPPLPLACVWGFAAAHLLSALWASDHQGLAFKFALRMTGAALFALAAAAATPLSRQLGLRTLAVAGTIVASVAVLEGLGAPGLERAVAFFHGPRHESGRAFAGSESPNLAAAMISYGFVAAMGVLSFHRRALPMAVAWAVVLSFGLLTTLSRGGIGATALALVAFAAAVRGREGLRASAPLGGLAMLVAATAAFLAGGPALRNRLATEIVVSGYGARYEPTEAAWQVAPGERRTATVQVTNTGRGTWHDGQIFLTCLWYEVEPRVVIEWRTRCPRVPLPREVRPGESLRLDVPVTAPLDEGRHLLGWEMVDSELPFSAYGVPPGVVAVTVARDGGALFSFEGQAGLGRRGRVELFRLAWLMWRDHPWMGVGPDNFRWLNARYGGWTGGLPLDSTQRAHNVYLEAAATTGVLGLLGLVATLAATAVAAWRALRGADMGSEGAGLSAVVVGLVTAIAAHGMVDTVLPFTGHYLVFGFVVGCAAALSRPA
jgi:O-antigen ligase